MRDIGKNIKQLRIQKNMTQDELAEKLFVTRQTVSNYETGKSRPDVDMLVMISEVFETDIQQVIYGPEPKRLSPEVRRLIVGVVLTAVFAVLWVVLKPIARQIQLRRYSAAPELLIFWLIGPPCCLFGGWTMAHILGMALNKKPLSGTWPRRIGVILLVVLIIWFALFGWYCIAIIVNDWQFENHIRGEWTDTVSITSDGEKQTVQGWSKLPPQVPEWVIRIATLPISSVTLYLIYPAPMVLPGAALWLCGIPRYRKQKQ